MFKLGGISQKVWSKARGISYKLGIFKGQRFPETELIETSKIPEEYQNWFPGKEKIIDECKRKLDEYKAKGISFVNR
jgi:hypothetical protein